MKIIRNRKPAKKSYKLRECSCGHIHQDVVGEKREYWRKNMVQTAYVSCVKCGEMVVVEEVNIVNRVNYGAAIA